MIIDIESMENLEVGTAPYEFLLSYNGNLIQSLYSNANTNANGELIFSGLSAGNYSLEIRDAEYESAIETPNCTDTFDFVLNELEPLNYEINLTEYECDYNVSCFGATDGEISLDITGGAGNYQYTWYSVDILENGGYNLTGFLGNNEVLQNIGAGSYYVSVVDGNLCSIDSETILITLIEPSEISISNTTQNVNCFQGSDGSINITLNGGCVSESSPFYNINWLLNGEEIIINPEDNNYIQSSQELDPETGNVSFML